MTAKRRSAPERMHEVKEMENDCKNEKKIKIDFDYLTVEPPLSGKHFPGETEGFTASRVTGERPPRSQGSPTVRIAALLDQLQIEF